MTGGPKDGKCEEMSTRHRPRLALLLRLTAAMAVVVGLLSLFGWRSGGSAPPPNPLPPRWRRPPASPLLHSASGLHCGTIAAQLTVGETSVMQGAGGKKSKGDG